MPGNSQSQPDKDYVVLARRAAAAALATQKGGPDDIIAGITAAIVHALDDGQCEKYIDSGPIFAADNQVMVSFGLKPGIPMEKAAAAQQLARSCYEGMEAVLKEAKVRYVPDQADGILSFDKAHFSGAILPVVTQQSSPQERHMAAATLFGARSRINAAYAQLLTERHQPNRNSGKTPGLRG